ncbi:MAG: mucoidy inhibitor MuiA family protein [Rhodospirillales bacterium]|nr:mucoidy inhibitor MuiA family protein [Rhodospirillales bacterium]
MNSAYAAVLALVLASVSGTVQAQVSPAYPISAVTVFPDRAAVTRRIEVDLLAGPNKLIVGDLPATLLPESVRVDGSAATAVRLGAVEVRNRFAERPRAEIERRLREEIEALQDRRHALDDEIRSAQAQLDFIAALGRDAPVIATEERARGILAPQGWEQAWATVSAGTGDALRRIREAQQNQRAIDRELAAKHQELAQIASGGPGSVEVSIHLEAAAAGRAELALTYQVPNASWRPLYEARLATETGEIVLTALGEVRQHTGEDWSDVALTLSTARPALGAIVPRLEPWFIGVIAVPSSKAKAGDEIGGTFGEFREEDANLREFAAASPDQPIDPAVAVLAGSEFSAEYRVVGTASVPADGSSHRFMIADRDMRSTLSVISTPRFAPAGYLIATATHEGKEPLLPGPVSVFRDGSYVGLAQIGVTRPGDKLELSFGADDKVKIEYRLVNDGRSQEGLITTERRIDRQYRITIANHHDEALEITVLDQIPVSQDERIEVELLKSGTKPTEADPEGRKGVLAWRYLYKPGEERVIDFRYAVTAPADLPVAGM